MVMPADGIKTWADHAIHGTRFTSFLEQFYEYFGDHTEDAASADAVSTPTKRKNESEPSTTPKRQHISTIGDELVIGMAKIGDEAVLKKVPLTAKELPIGGNGDQGWKQSLRKEQHRGATDPVCWQHARWIRGGELEARSTG